MLGRTGIERIDVRAGRVDAIVTTNGERMGFDAYVSALPPSGLLRVLPEDVRRTAPFSRPWGVGLIPSLAGVGTGLATEVGT